MQKIKRLNCSFLACIFLAGLMFFTGTTGHTQAAPEDMMIGMITPADMIIGDVNTDGFIDIIDALMVAQYAIGLNPEGFNPLVADVNNDHKINIIDALVIAQYAVGLFSPGKDQ